MTDTRGKRHRALKKRWREREKLINWLDGRCLATWGEDIEVIVERMRKEEEANGCQCCGDYCSSHLGTLIRAYGFLAGAQDT